MKNSRSINPYKRRSVASTCSSVWHQERTPISSDNVNERIADLFSEMDEEDVVFDIGAHIGLNSCVIGRRYPEIGLVCFEPHPQTRGNLETNLELNGIDALVMDCAISNSDGSVVFDTRHDTPGGMGEVHRSGQERHQFERSIASAR